MFHIVLFEPEIPPNTGNIIRLAANTACQLHLIEPLGFELEDKRLRRAGLDYQEWAQVKRYRDFNNFKYACKFNNLYAFSTKARPCYTTARFEPEDALLFGPETRGLPANILKSLGSDNCLRIPMVANSRSLNLSNTVAIVVYEAWRQLDFSLD
ncbi:MAG: tRNA (cytidine(34)-2'-O)-methyltransferase [Gammaproteobacteria bacterium]|nr:tRNA (cytidine(34)-2'-O)-methyltransferase [Gammaproteobacteria bacterium]